MKRSVVSAAAAAVLSSASSVQGFSIAPALSRAALSPPSLAVRGGMGNIAASSSSTAMRATAVSEEDFIKKEIANNKGMHLNNKGLFTWLAVNLSDTCDVSVVVFSKTYCPYCTRTKDLFQSLNVVGDDIMIYELDTMKNGDAIQNALLSLTGQRTVPNVFVLGQQIGGNDKTQAAAQTGRLQKMLGI
jgi:glutaredoxin 3